MRPRAVEFDLIAQIHHGLVDACPDESLAAHPLELQLQLAFPCARDRRQNAELRPLWHGKDPVDDLLHRLSLDALAAARAVRHADAGIEQTKVVGDLGDRPHGGPRRLGQRPLLDRDGWTEPLDPFDVRLGELLEKLPRVRAERLDVSPLPLGVDRVERKRRLA